MQITILLKRVEERTQWTTFNKEWEEWYFVTNARYIVAYQANMYKILKLKCHFSPNYEAYYAVLITRANSAKPLLMNHVTVEVAELAQFHPSNRFAPQSSISCYSALILDITNAPHSSSVRWLRAGLVLKATVGLTRRNSYVNGHKIEDNISKAEIRTLESRRNIHSRHFGTSKHPKYNCSGKNLLARQL